MGVVEDVLINMNIRLPSVHSEHSPHTKHGRRRCRSPTLHSTLCPLTFTPLYRSSPRTISALTKCFDVSFADQDVERGFGDSLGVVEDDD